MRKRREMKSSTEVTAAYREALSSGNTCHPAAEILCDLTEILSGLRSFGRKQRVECLEQEIQCILKAYDDVTEGGAR